MLPSLLFAFFCSATSALLFNISRRHILWSAMVGMLGWLAYLLIFEKGQQAVIATFGAALLIGLLGETLAIARKKPATIFILPGIIPLVPGAGMYYTMVALQSQNVSLAAQRGVQTVFTALAISCGLLISLSLLRLVRRQLQKMSSDGRGSAQGH